MGTAVQVEGAAAVQTLSDGRLAVWVGEEGDAVVMAFDPAFAVETARRMLVAAGYDGCGDRPPDVVTGISLRPAASAHEPARLTIEYAGGEIPLLIDLANLAELAAAADKALKASPPAGTS